MPSRRTIIEAKILNDQNVALQNRAQSSQSTLRLTIVPPPRIRVASDSDAVSRTGKRQRAPIALCRQVCSNRLCPKQRAGVCWINEVARAQVRIGAMQGMWIGDELIFLRRIVTAQGESLQGVWMDAAATAAFCQEAMADILPGAKLLAPRQLSPRDKKRELRCRADAPGEFTLCGGGPDAGCTLDGGTAALLVALGIAAWIAVCSAALLVFFASALAERRAAFVSAVTHELRTPLTALRLHADLLANERIGADPERRAKAVHTLRESGSRLAGLIDNVLDYARLERRRAPCREPIPLAPLLEREVPAWQQR